MSTLTKFSAIPYTGPAPTNRQPYVPADVERIDGRGAEIASKLNNPAITQERGQDLPTFLVERKRIIDVLTALRDHAELFGYNPVARSGNLGERPCRSIDREQGGARHACPLYKS